MKHPLVIGAASAITMAGLKRLASFILLVAMTQLAGCSAVRHVSTPVAKVVMAAQEDLNPDDQGRASPVAVKILELTTRAALDSLDFTSVWNNSTTVLSDELLSISQLVLLPGQTLTHRIELAPRTEYIAVIAAYRHMDDARWKLVYPVNSDWFSTHEVFFSACAVELGKTTGCRMSEKHAQP